MTKLDYTMSNDDIAVLDQMRLKGNPVLLIITLDTKETKAKIEKNLSKSDLPEGKRPIDVLKEMAHKEDELENKPCIAVFLLDVINKKSNMPKEVIVATKWVPLGAKGTQKMIYTSAWNSLKVELGKSSISSCNMFEACDWEEMEDKTNEM